MRGGASLPFQAEQYERGEHCSATAGGCASARLHPAARHARRACGLMAQRLEEALALPLREQVRHGQHGRLEGVGLGGEGGKVGESDLPAPPYPIAPLLTAADGGLGREGRAAQEGSPAVERRIETGA